MIFKQHKVDSDSGLDYVKSLGFGLDTSFLLLAVYHTLIGAKILSYACIIAAKAR